MKNLKEKSIITWLGTNIGTIVISLILVGIISAIVVKLIKDKKQGKSSCGCGCTNCAMRGHCHN